MPIGVILALVLMHAAHMSAPAFALTCSIDAQDVLGTTSCLSAAAASMYVNTLMCFIALFLRLLCVHLYEQVDFVTLCPLQAR